jgi:hypothetical protein
MPRKTPGDLERATSLSSRRGRSPKVDREVRALIRRMCQDNSVTRPDEIVAIRNVGGLHHEYSRLVETECIARFSPAQCAPRLAKASTPVPKEHD